MAKQLAKVTGLVNCIYWDWSQDNLALRAVGDSCSMVVVLVNSGGTGPLGDGEHLGSRAKHVAPLPPVFVIKVKHTFSCCL